ncbi:hypothetical protein F975_02509 [Acinetobacter sp. ANC 3789]|nr:hypothetical protein F975_02509 [Acinetobacter sp. ANC 3789]
MLLFKKINQKLCHPQNLFKTFIYLTLLQKQYITDTQQVVDDISHK